MILLTARSVDSLGSWKEAFLQCLSKHVVLVRLAPSSSMTLERRQTSPELLKTIKVSRREGVSDCEGDTVRQQQDRGVVRGFDAMTYLSLSCDQVIK